MNGSTILFYCLASLSILSAVGVISSRSPVYSALSLVVTLFSLAGIYVLLHAEFFAIIQVFTYAGAILVLFVFIIMLLNLQPAELEEKGYPWGVKVLLGIISLSFFLGLGYVLRGPLMPAVPLPPGFGSVASVGEDLFSYYLIPFEVAGILLTVALVGAVLLAKRKLA